MQSRKEERLALYDGMYTEIYESVQDDEKKEQLSKEAVEVYFRNFALISYDYPIPVLHRSRTIRIMWVAGVRRRFPD